VEARDSGAAATAMRSHLNATQRDLLAALRQDSIRSA
jgi:DNA-binding GntR family transcriptional regulator